MNLLTNNSPVELMLMTNKVKKSLLSVEGLTWTDLLVICVLHQLEEESRFITSTLIIDRLNMNKCWIYRSIRRLEAKKLILVSHRPHAASYLCTSGWGKILLQRVAECIRGIDPCPLNLMD